MIIVDTSVWITHLNHKDQDLVDLMQKEIVIMHEFVLLELACGSLKNRRRLLSDLKQIPSIEPVSPTETLSFIEDRSLHGIGLGMVDVNILATCKKNKLFVYTHDTSLKRQAMNLKLFSFR